MTNLTDRRRLPFFCVTKAGVACVRRHFTGRRAISALAIYSAFVEAENDARANGEPFAKPRKEIARLACVAPRVIDEYAEEFERIGLLTIERVAIEGQNLPHRWTLLDPPVHQEHDKGEPVRSDPVTEGGGDPGAASDAQSGGGEGQEGTPAVAKVTRGSAVEVTTTTQEERQEDGGGDAPAGEGGELVLLPDLGNGNGKRARSTKRESQPRKIPDDFPDALRETLEAILGPLRRVAEGKGAYTIAPAAVAITMKPRAQSLDAEQFSQAADDFEAYWLFGKGATRNLSDVVAAYRNWLDNAIGRQAERGSAGAIHARTDLQGLDVGVER